MMCRAGKGQVDGQQPYKGGDLGRKRLETPQHGRRRLESLPHGRQVPEGKETGTSRTSQHDVRRRAEDAATNARSLSPEKDTMLTESDSACVAHAKMTENVNRTEAAVRQRITSMVDRDTRPLTSMVDRAMRPPMTKQTEVFRD